MLSTSRSSKKSSAAVDQPPKAAGGCARFASLAVGTTQGYCRPDRWREEPPGHPAATAPGRLDGHKNQFYSWCVVQVVDTAPQAELDPLRERLLDAAAHVFAQKGYSGTRILDVVAAAGLSTGAVYGRFGSK
ncbi:MAG: TetR/AcrR family transcriptional regulator, partial [Acidimicrobiales bacterium]